MAQLPAAEWGLEQCTIYAKNPELCSKQDIWHMLFVVKHICERQHDTVENIAEEVDKCVVMYLATGVFKTLREDSIHEMLDDNAPPLTNESRCFIMGRLRKIFHMLQVIGYLSGELCVMK